jgi:beta-glucanase (GH16 family)
MYMLANLAVGGQAGEPADGLKDGADMKIDYIKAYSLDDPTVSALTHSTHTTSDWHI